MANPPEWLHQFADEVSAQLIGVEQLAPIGCHIYQGAGPSEVTLFVSSTEVIGGVHDGRLRVSRFFVDLQALTQVFDSIRSFAWQAQGLGSQDDIGPHVAIEGDYRGHPVWLRIPAIAPKPFPAGRHAHAHLAQWEEVW